MHQPNPQSNSYLLLLIEAGLTLVAIAAAFSMPRLQSGAFARIELFFGKFARRRFLACITVGTVVLGLRLALLPWFPVPNPFLPDDFSFLLAADTFVHGRLTNPMPLMWPHFESIHITLYPTYQSMYFPAPGLILAAGKALFGNPWAGLLITCALMCMALCWMLQAWVPPGWALLGGFLAVLRLGLFSYWINTYTGGGTIAALGGALVLGALPRLTRTGRFRYGMLLAAGVALMAICRPYEGLLICVPAAMILGHWVLFGKNRPPLLTVARRALAPVALIAAVLAWLGYYDYKAFGSPKTLPYTVARTTYAVVPYYIWQAKHRAPEYSSVEMRRFYTETEAIGFNELHSHDGFVMFYVRKINTTLVFFAGLALLPPLIMAGRVIRDRRLRVLVWCSPLWIVGMAIGIYLIPHYLAVFTAVLYAFGLQAMRHLRVWEFKGEPVGQALVRLIVVVCVVMAGLRTVAEPLHLAPPMWPISPWVSSWVGPGDFGADRAAIAAELERKPGNHLVLVRYADRHQPVFEWVYNGADLDGSRIIWARDMDATSNEELIRYYGDRDVWLVQPDAKQGRLTPYPLTNELAAGQ